MPSAVRSDMDVLTDVLNALNFVISVAHHLFVCSSSLGRIRRGEARTLPRQARNRPVATQASVRLPHTSTHRPSGPFFSVFGAPRVDQLDDGQVDTLEPRSPQRDEALSSLRLVHRADRVLLPLQLPAHGRKPLASRRCGACDS